MATTQPTVFTRPQKDVVAVSKAALLGQVLDQRVAHDNAEDASRQRADDSDHSDSDSSRSEQVVGIASPTGTASTPAGRRRPQAMHGVAIVQRVSEEGRAIFTSPTARLESPLKANPCLLGSPSNGSARSNGHVSTSGTTNSPHVRNKNTSSNNNNNNNGIDRSDSIVEMITSAHFRRASSSNIRSASSVAPSPHKSDAVVYGPARAKDLYSYTPVDPDPWAVGVSVSVGTKAAESHVHALHAMMSPLRAVRSPEGTVAVTDGRMVEQVPFPTQKKRNSEDDSEGFDFSVSGKCFSLSHGFLNEDPFAAGANDSVTRVSVVVVVSVVAVIVVVPVTSAAVCSCGYRS